MAITPTATPESTADHGRTPYPTSSNVDAARGQPDRLTTQEQKNPKAVARTVVETVSNVDTTMDTSWRDARERASYLFTDELTQNATVALPDGSPVVVMVWRDQLTCWPLNGADATTVALPRRAEVSFEGSSPLVTAEEKGYTVSNGELIEHPVPYLTTPVAANGSVIVAAEPNGTWWSVPATGTPTLTAPTVPEDASVASQVITLMEDRAVILWQTPGDGDRPGPDTVVGIHDLATGDVEATATVPNSAIPRSAPLVSSDDNTQLAIGPVISSQAEDGLVAQIHDDLTPIISVGNTVYGTLHRHPRGPDLPRVHVRTPARDHVGDVPHPHALLRCIAGLPGHGDRRRVVRTDHRDRAAQCNGFVDSDRHLPGCCRRDLPGRAVLHEGDPRRRSRGCRPDRRGIPRRPSPRQARGPSGRVSRHM